MDEDDGRGGGIGEVGGGCIASLDVYILKQLEIMCMLE